MALVKRTYTGFPGYYTTNNSLNFPEGANVVAENVVYRTEDLIEPRHGISTWQVREVDAAGTVTTNYLGIPPPVSFTAADVSVADDWITVVGHGLSNGQIVKLTSSGAIPGGLATGTIYYVVNVTADTFQLSLTSAGAAINITSTGSSTVLVNYAQSYENLFYWNTTNTKTFVTSLKLDNGTYKFIEITPQDYNDTSATAKYRFIQNSSSTNLEITDPSVTNSPFISPNFVQTDNGLYATTKRGLYVARSSSFPTTSMVSADLPNTAIVTAKAVNGSDDNWLSNGKACKVVAVVRRDIGNNITVEGKPSLTFEVRNQLGVSRIVRVTVKTDPLETIMVYRTLSYNLARVEINADGSPNVIDGEFAPTDYFQASGEITTDSGGLATVDLIFNDDILNVELPRLYTSSSEQGSESTNMKAPLAGDMLQFKGHTCYLDVLPQPVGKLQLLSLSATTNPATDGLDGETIKLDGTTFTYKDQDFTTVLLPGGTGATLALGAIPVETNPPETLNGSFGIFNDELGYVAPGVGTVATAIKVLTRPFNAASGGSGDVIPDLVSTGNSYSAPDLTVTIDPSKFDFKKFNVSGGGFCYAVKTDNTTFATLFRYKTVEQLTATTMKFGEIATALGDAIGSIPAACNFYYVPGTNSQNLPIYLGSHVIQTASVALAGTDPLGSTVEVPYYTLVPSRKRSALIIGRVRQAHSTPAADGSDGYRYLQINPEFYGATNRSLTQLIDGTVANIARWINVNATTSADYFATPSTQEANTLLIESDFEAIAVTVSAGTQLKYEPNLSTSATNLANLSDSRIKSGLVISKLNTPELVPAISALAPTPVGSPANRGTKLAATRDDLYVFKEKEGIYRVSMQQGIPTFPVAILTQIVQLDTTVIPIAPESVQTLDDQVYFLSDRGFCRIVNGSVEFISGPIEQDIKTAAARTPDLSKVRAVADRGKRLYICHFPDTSFTGFGSTFVFNTRTGKWSTSSVNFSAAATDSVGRLTTLSSDYLLDGAPETTAEIDAAILTTARTRTWQYLRQESFTGREKEFVYDSDFQAVVDLAGDPVYILNTGTNVTDSSYDQYDERLTGFTSIALSGTQLTLTRTKSGDFANRYPDLDFKDFVNRLRDKSLFYRGQVGSEVTLVPVTVTSTTSSSTSTSITLTLPTGTTPVPQALTDELLVGVNAVMEFTAYHAGTPSLLKQFSKFGTHFQDRQEPNSLPSLISFEFAVDNQEDFSNPTVFDTVVVKRTFYETLVPLTATRGRFLRVRITHNKPEEYFLLNGNSVSYKSTSSDNVSLR